MPASLAMVPYGLTHGWVIAATVLAAAALVAAWPIVARHPNASRRLALVTLAAIWIATQAWHLRPGHLRLDRSLPLHLCDITGLVAMIAVATRAAWARSVLHHWAVCLCTLAYLAPAVREGPGDVRFWTYWLSHAAILLAAVGDYTLAGFRPDPRTLRQALATLGLYVWLVFPLNALFNLNYGYIGPAASASRAMLSRLGDWPLRVAWLELIAVVGMASMTVLLRRRESERRHFEAGLLLAQAMPLPRALPQPRPLAA